MKEQKYKLRNVESFELRDIFECGQCFRWNKQEDGSYTGVFKNNVLNVKKNKDEIIFEGICENEIQQTVENYFDLNRNYEKIKEQLSKIDQNMKMSIEYGNGIRILNQDLWETIISFIISANNNIPRIKGIIERLSEKYGDEIKYKGNKYYTFPTPEQLKNVTVEEYRKLGLGFRDIRLYETTKMILNKQVDIENMKNNPNTIEVREELILPMRSDLEDYSLENGYMVTKEFLEKQIPCTAIFAISDMLAIGAGKALSDAGYKVPEDISLTGFDGVEIGKYVIPSLTTLKQPVDSMARETARILFDIIGKKAKHQHCVFDGELVVRDSTMPRT